MNRKRFIRRGKLMGKDKKLRQMSFLLVATMLLLSVSLVEVQRNLLPWEPKSIIVIVL